MPGFFDVGGIAIGEHRAAGDHKHENDCEQPAHEVLVIGRARSAAAPLHSQSRRRANGRSSTFMMARRSLPGIVDHAPISESVRPQPRQSLLAASMTQTLMQGLSMLIHVLTVTR